VIIDTELWPNIIHQCAARNTKTMLVNARLSAQSAAGYRKISSLTRSMLMDMDYISAQTAAQGQRFLDLGLAEEKLLISGSIKFDQRLPKDFKENVAQLREKVGDRLVIIGASTHAGEEEIILSACRPLRDSHEELLLILAPRHPHRSDEVATWAEKEGETLVRHSDEMKCVDSTTVLLLDTLGELTYFYGISDIAIIGGSFVPVGGHNLMEAACANVPIIMGPYLDHIDDIASMFSEKGGMLIAQNAAELGRQLEALLSSVQERKDLVARANAVLKSNQGALEEVENLIVQSIARAELSS
jgi:3-deoxy-D-manno-octulosonic-acid transferase